MASIPQMKRWKSGTREHLRPRVLLLDDDPAIADFVRSSFAVRDYEIVWAASVRAAQASLRCAPTW